MSEWIKRVTAETSWEDITINPSAINPYPQMQENGNFDVSADAKSRMPQFGSNWYVHTRYANGNVYRTQMPTFHDVERHDPEPETPSAPKSQNWQAYEPDQMQSFKSYWDKESALLAQNYLVRSHREEIVEHFKSLRSQNLEYDVRGFFDANIAQYTEFMQSGRPAGAFALASRMFSERIFVGSNDVLSPYAVEEFRHALPVLVEPKLELNNISNRPDMRKVRYARDWIGHTGLILMQGHLQAEAITSLTQNPGYSAAVQEKVALYQAREKLQMSRLAKNLLHYADELPQELTSARITELKKMQPQEMGKYLLNLAMQA